MVQTGPTFIYSRLRVKDASEKYHFGVQDIAMRVLLYYRGATFDTFTTRQ